MHFLRHCNASRRLVGVALLALLLGQWTVLAHSIAHARTTAASGVSVEADHAWDHAAGTPTCHLVDHLLAGQAPAGELARPPCVPAATPLAAAPSSSLALGPIARAYAARGPPRA